MTKICKIYEILRSKEPSRVRPSPSRNESAFHVHPHLAAKVLTLLSCHNHFLSDMEGEPYFVSAVCDVTTVKCGSLVL
jgi:hypothetical protein